MMLLMDELKTQTRHLHEMLDKHSGMTRLMESELNTAVYADILRRMAGFYQPLEAQFEAVYDSSPLLKELHWHEKRRKMPRLTHDLSVLDGQMLPVPECSFVPTAATEGERLGILYVLEGATLGGQIIKRQLLAHPELSPRAVTFFAGYDQETGAMWQEFKAICNARGTDYPAEQGDAVDSACATFTALIQWMG